MHKVKRCIEDMRLLTGGPWPEPREEETIAVNLCFMWLGEYGEIDVLALLALAECFRKREQHGLAGMVLGIADMGVLGGVSHPRL